ncbi:MAG TPA: DMT family transporter [Gaiellaceae bacterium]|nr:DMT family transporter [Gaiellaceae bacterium]
MRWNVAVAALAASFGFVSIIVREVDLDAEVLVFFRCVFAVATISLVLTLTRRLDVLARRATLRFALPLGTTLGAHWFLFFETIKLSSVVLAVLTAYLAPIAVALLGPFFLPERHSPVALAALVPSIGGLALVAFAGGDDVNARPLAVLTGIGTAVTYAGLVIGTKHVAERVSAAALTFWNYTLSGLVMIPFLLTADRIVPHAGELGYVVLLGIVFTAGTGYLYVWLIRRVTAQAMGILAYLEPVSAALLAWLLLDEALTWRTIFGGALIILGGLAVILLEREETGVVEVPPQPEGSRMRA